MYRAGIYLRLSREDAVSGRKPDSVGRAESDSIRSQRELCLSFVDKQDDMELCGIYTDDGYSGANFDRPGFRRMMEDVEAGRVNCVVVKDLSRFGRDYIEAGRLIQRVFPALNVRFIAVTERFDSLTAGGNETSFVLPVRNFVNDSYCRDISGKVRSHQKVKREKGEFIGAFPVYGYRKKDGERNKLEPDPYAAGIVRGIFRWRMEGMSSLAIADKLNGMGVLSPLEYKRSRGENYTTGFAAGMGTSWSPVAVKRILSNEIYTGTMVQGKTEKLSYKLDERRAKPPEEWSRVDGTHEPIVSREDFDRVQKLLAVGGRASGGERKAHLFSGLLFCGDCGQPMIRRVNRHKGAERVYFICSTRNKGKGCSRHSMLEEELRRIVLTALQLQTAVLSDVDERFSSAAEPETEELFLFEEELERLRRERENGLSLRFGLDEDVREGILTGEDVDLLRELWEKRGEGVREAIGKQERMLRVLFRERLESAGRLERFKEKPELTELSRDALLAFVEKIAVYEDKRVCIELKSRERFCGALVP